MFYDNRWLSSSEYWVKQNRKVCCVELKTMGLQKMWINDFRLKMPGHIKKSDGPDPDPDPWLVVSPELRIKLKAKPYDPKKSCWVPDKATGGYWEGLIDSTDGDKVTVQIKETGDVSWNELI